MISLPRFQYRFTPKWLMCLITSLAIILLTSLGCWQLRRAQEKTDMLSRQQDQAQQHTSEWVDKPGQYQRIAVKGTYLSQNYLLDNQYHEHQIGYNVLSPLLIDKQRVVIIDRGWVPANNNRQQLPQIESPSAEQTLSGQAYYPSDKTWVLGETVERQTGNITLVESPDIKIISQLLHKPVYPFIIRLDKSEANGYVREWQVVSMPPERHKAYAVQWFAMALLALVLFIILNLKKIDENLVQK